MWLNFGEHYAGNKDKHYFVRSELINTNSISQIILKEVEGKWCIEFLRIDGSYITSFDYYDEEKAKKAYEEIMEKVLDGDTVNVWMLS